jgi:mRNA interferase RelE/StbE
MSSNPSSVAATYRLQIKESAAKELGSLGNKKDRERFATRINSLAVDPSPPEAEKLVYSINDQHRIILIVKIGDRKEVYR